MLGGYRLKISKKKMLLKMIISFSIIFLVATATLSTSIFGYFSRTYREEVDKYNSKILSQAQKTIDLYLLREIDKLQSDLISYIMFDDDMSSYVASDTVSSVSISNIYKRLTEMKNESNMLQTISVYSCASNTIISTVGVKFLDDSKNERYLDTPWIEKMEKAADSKLWIDSTFNMVSDNGLESNIIYFVASYPYNATADKRKAIISISVDEKELFSEIIRVVPEQFGQIFIIDSENKIVSHQNKSLIGTKPAGMEFIDKIDSISEDGFFLDSYNGNEIAVNYRSSEFYDWRYIVADEYDMVYHRGNVIQITILFISIIVCLVGIIVIIIFSANLYKPFKRLVQSAGDSLRITSENSDVDLNAMNEFNIIDLAFESMNQNIQTLEEFVEERKTVLRRAFLNNLISGEKAAIHISDKNMELLGFNFPHDRFVLVVAEFIDDMGHSKIENETYGQIIQGIENRAVFGSIQVAGFMTYKRNVAFLLNYANEDRNKVYDFCSWVCDTVDDRFSKTLVLGVGGESLGIANISASYKQALEALHSRLINTDCKVFVYQESCVKQKSITHDIELITKLIENIKLRNKDCVKESIDLIIDYIVKEQYSIESVREYIIFVATYLTKLTYDMGYNEQEVFGGNITQDFSRVSSIDELKIRMDNYCLRFVDFLEAQKSMRKSVLVQQVMKYMRDNKQNDLSLIVVADSAGVSPSFLSKVFKDETGIKFVDYSIQLKLEYAKTLLERKNVSTEEVSLKVGYSQTQYFIKKFKAQYGITPKQYQMKFLNELNFDG